MTALSMRIQVFGIAACVLISLTNAYGVSDFDEADAAISRRDFGAAYRAWRSLAARGYSVAQYNLGKMYLSGQGVRQSDERAYMWFTQAAANGHAAAFQEANSLARRLSSIQISAAQLLAQRCKASGFEDCGTDDLADVSPTPSPPPSPTVTTRPVPPVSAKPEESEAAKRKSTGSGFAISRDGYVITNAHVVEDCSRIAIRKDDRQLKANLRISDSKTDLALLKVERQFSTPLVVRTTSISLGEDVTVFGYPLSGLLSPNLSLTRGVVSSTSGLRGDSMQYQISAPIQPGNSGGPIVDSGGNVIGIVVATLDAIKTARITGSIPQNINFGIRSEALRLFLDANTVKYSNTSSTVTKNTADIARALSASIVLIECY